MWCLWALLQASAGIDTTSWCSSNICTVKHEHCKGANLELYVILVEPGLLAGCLNLLAPHTLFKQTHGHHSRDQVRSRN